MDRILTYISAIIALWMLNLLFFQQIPSFAGSGDEPCPDLVVNLKKGTLNKLKGDVSMEEVKAKLPCFTGDTEEGTEFNCGGGVFFLNHDFFFYTGRDYIEIRSEFEGKLSAEVLGISREALIRLMGAPDDELVYESDFFDERSTYLQYSKKWGTLVFVERENAISKIEMHYKKKIGEIAFCF